MTARRISIGGLAASVLAVILFVLVGRGTVTVQAHCDDDCSVPLNGNRYDNHNAAISATVLQRTNSPMTKKMPSGAVWVTG